MGMNVFVVVRRQDRRGKKRKKFLFAVPNYFLFLILSWTCAKPKHTGGKKKKKREPKRPDVSLSLFLPNIQMCTQKRFRFIYTRRLVAEVIEDDDNSLFEENSRILAKSGNSACHATHEKKKKKTLRTCQIVFP